METGRSKGLHGATQVQDSPDDDAGHDRGTSAVMRMARNDATKDGLSNEADGRIGREKPRQHSGSSSLGEGQKRIRWFGGRGQCAAEGVTQQGTTFRDCGALSPNAAGGTDVATSRAGSESLTAAACWSILVRRMDAASSDRNDESYFAQSPALAAALSLKTSAPRTPGCVHALPPASPVTH